MGRVIEQIYNVVEQKSGLTGRMRLSQHTGLAKSDSLQVDDSAELVEKVKEVASEILGKDVSQYLT